jgi:hypothetical protein
MSRELKRATAGAVAAAKRHRAAPETRLARVRMYRHGLGDCFLLRFPKAHGGTFNILIDCGIIGVAEEPKATMAKVVKDIAKECDGHIDLVIMTHEHWDHASGFSTQQVQAEFDKLDIDEAWYAWTEDPENKLGRKLRRERAAKLKALQVAALALRKAGSPLAMQRADRVESLLQFFGVGGETSLAAAKAAMGKSEAAFKYLAQRRGVRTRYCYPDKAPQALPGVDDVRVYVLGPPEDEARIKRSAPTKKGKEVYEFGAEAAMDDSLGIAFERAMGEGMVDSRADCPFDAEASITVGGSSRPIPAKLANLLTNLWDNPEFAYRRIEDDWTANAETLALNLDSHTNNTCLVVAFELVKTGQVLLFAADAQVGNWLSWQDTHWHVKEGGETRVVRGPDLLQRTVFYKVGHHGSHNATLRALGLEQMTSEDLVAFVPVFKAQAEKNRWMGMPFKPLVKRLKEKTGGRLVFSDPKMKAPAAADLDNLTAAQKKRFIAGLAAHELYYEYSFDA